MTDLQEVRASLRPTGLVTTYAAAKACCISTVPWDYSKVDGRRIEKGYRYNKYQSSQWLFGGRISHRIGDKDERWVDPLALTIWYPEIKIDATLGTLVVRGNVLDYSGVLAKDLPRGPVEKRRLSDKVRKALEYDEALRDAYRSGAPVRAFIVDGINTTAQQERTSSAEVKKRVLDEQRWYVHAYDGEPDSETVGQFLMVRGIEPDTAPDDEVQQTGPQERHNLQDLQASEREAVIKARIGQAMFRGALLNRWGGACAVTGCAIEEVLIASHIVPWRECKSRTERLIESNGLLLGAHLDRLFDQYLISFDDDGFLLLRRGVNSCALQALGIRPGMRLRAVFDDNRPYLQRHREAFLARDSAV